MTSPRIQPLNRQKVFVGGKYVLYLMDCLRSQASPSYSFAAKCANEQSIPVLAVYMYNPCWHNLAQRVFLFEGLESLRASLTAQGVALLPITILNNDDALKKVIKLSDCASEVITDAYYLREQRNLVDAIADNLTDKSRKCTMVEGNSVVPVPLVSDEAAMGARVIRSKVWPHVNAMLAEKWIDVPKKKCNSWKSLVVGDMSELNVASELAKARKELGSKLSFNGGEDAAQKVLKNFIAERLKTYDQLRNVPGEENQSCLSPYLHFGMISPVEVIRQVNASKVPKSAKDAYFEELVIRRELSHNFVYYYRDTYDSFKCLPNWVQLTMKIHKADKRDYVYTYEQLELGKTHEKCWNAAQLELVHSHKMHGYMRMYWAKKVIEWTNDYESAYKFLIEQNDKYELDGHDANGYAGVMWNFGMHDRAHGERHVFGKIRYMNEAGLLRKFKKSIEKYVELNYKLAGRKSSENIEPPKKKARV